MRDSEIVKGWIAELRVRRKHAWCALRNDYLLLGTIAGVVATGLAGIFIFAGTVAALTFGAALIAGGMAAFTLFQKVLREMFQDEKELAMLNHRIPIFERDCQEIVRREENVQRYQLAAEDLSLDHRARSQAAANAAKEEENIAKLMKELERAMSS